MKSYSFNSSFVNFKYRALNFVKANSAKIIILGVLAVLALVTGIFSAVKFLQGNTTIIFSDFGLQELVSGSAGSGSMFFQRMGSITVVMIFLTLFSLHSSMFVLGGVIIVYRTFLLGLNVTFILLLHGLGGVITALLIILPLQLLMLVLMIAFFVLARDRCAVKSKYGTKGGVNLFILIIVFLLALALVNLIETFLLVLTSAKMILII